MNFKVKRTLLVILGILGSCIFLTIAILPMDWKKVVTALSSYSLYPWFCFSTISYIVGHFIRGLRTRLLISRDARISITTATNIVLVGYAVNNFLPARIGEFARAGMLRERTGISFVQSLTVVFIERIFDGFAIALLFFSAFLLLGSALPVQYTILLSSVIFGAALLFILFIAFAPHRFVSLISKAVYALSPRLHDFSIRLTTSLVNGARYISAPLNIVKIGVLSILIWLCDVGLYLFLLPAFGQPADVLHAAFIMGLTNFSIIFPFGFGYSSPGYLGPFHTQCIKSLILLNVPYTSAQSFAIVAHLAIYMTLLIWGGIVILWYGITLGLTANLTKRAKFYFYHGECLSITGDILGLKTSDIVAKPTSQFIYKLSEAAVPYDEYETPDPQEVVSYVADFIQGAIRNLSKKFKLLFAVGMFGFNAIVWLRYFRPYSALSLEIRRAIFNRWAYGRNTVQRQLFKLIRSTALLAFFEHPSVVAVMERRENRQ